MLQYDGNFVKGIWREIIFLSVRRRHIYTERKIFRREHGSDQFEKNYDIQFFPFRWNGK